MSAWQPIDTAPKDGTSVLLSMPSGRVEIGSWFHSMHTRNGAITYENEGWSCGGLGSYFERAPNPTHWMPLPEAVPVQSDIDTEPTSATFGLFIPVPQDQASPQDEDRADADA
jgi:hypothetical protein